MPFDKKNKSGGGRPPGSPNKATRNARELISVFIDNQAERLDSLLNKVEAENGPKAAWDCIMSLTEFALPKLARTELTGANGGPVQVQPIASIDHEALARYYAAKEITDGTT